MARFVAAFAIRHLSSAIRHPPFVICHLPFVICHLPFVICHFSFPIPRAEFRIPHFLESGTGYPISGTKETWLAPFGSAPFDPGWPLSTLFLDTAALTASSFSSFHWPLATDHCSPATRPSSRRPPGPAGSGRAQTLPRWLLPATDRPGSREVLLPPRPLRTVLETCASYGSSIHKRPLRDAAASVNGLHDTRLEPTNRMPDVLPFDGVPVRRAFGSRTSRHFCRQHICLSP